jgi:hypothetical protein
MTYDNGLQRLPAQSVEMPARAQRYSHRNGETEPPTEVGYFWFEGKFLASPHRVSWLPANMRVLVLERNNDTICVFEAYDGFTGVVDNFHGRWWGPLVPPREQQSPVSAFEPWGDEEAEVQP